MKIRSDKFKAYKHERDEMFQDMGMDAPPMPDCTPVDLYGKRVNLDKNDSTNLEKTTEDVKEFYGLEDSGY